MAESLADNNQGPKRKRNRALLSCSECHRRKSKCNRKVPCEQCIKRGVAHKCKWEPLLTKHGMESKRTSGDNGQEKNTLDIQNDIIPPEIEYPRITEDEPVQPAHSLNDFIQSVSQWPSTEPMPESGDAQILARTLTQRLPPREIADQLVRIYFEECNWLPQSMYEPRFHESYDKLWSRILPSNPLQSLALTYRLMSFALLFLPLDAKGIGKTVGKQSRDLMELYHLSSLKAQSASLEREPTTLERIQTLHMHSSWLKNQGKASEAFMVIGDAVKYAQEIRLHRDVKGFSPVETQLRRKVWAIVYTYDRMLSVILSRPYFINDVHCDARPPLNLEWDEIGLKPERPLTEITMSTFSVFENYLVSLGAKISATCFGPKTPTYATILQMDQELTKFEASLPVGLHPRISDSNPDVARLDAKLPTLRYSRSLLGLSTNSIRLHLHRAYFLHRSNKSYAYSSYVCLQSALRILDIEKKVRTFCSKSQYRWFWLSFELLDSSIIVAVAIVSDPHGPNAKRLRTELDEALDMLEMIKDYNVTAGPAANVVKLACEKVDAIIAGRKDDGMNRVVAIPYINTAANINALIESKNPDTHLPSPRTSPTILDTTFNFEEFLNSDMGLPSPDSSQWSVFEQPVTNVNSMPAAFDLFAGGEALLEFDTMLAQFIH